MCLFLLPVSLNCRPQISQGKGPENVKGYKLLSSNAPIATLPDYRNPLTHITFDLMTAWPLRIGWTDANMPHILSSELLNSVSISKSKDSFLEFIFVAHFSPKWYFSWCFSLANLDLKYSSQKEHLKGRSWVCRIMCSCR